MMATSGMPGRLISTILEQLGKPGSPSAEDSNGRSPDNRDKPGWPLEVFVMGLDNNV